MNLDFKWTFDLFCFFFLKKKKKKKGKNVELLYFGKSLNQLCLKLITLEAVGHVYHKGRKS